MGVVTLPVGSTKRGAWWIQAVENSMMRPFKDVAWQAQRCVLGMLGICWLPAAVCRCGACAVFCGSANRVPIIAVGAACGVLSGY